ncbi:MAG: hypothetical protein L6Q98_21265 [Anaerolineae bacterium]|nr:hypothetical protein [Anaerolineae bacterium]NUQ06118.1 hypothetical protein [Anaerolineae bacterium]
MAWTTPKNWSTGELVTASDLNVQLKGNLEILKDPVTKSTRFTPGTQPQITSTTFVDIDTSLSWTSGNGTAVTTAGGALMIGLSGRVYHSPGGFTDCYFDINIDGVSQGAPGTNGILWVYGSNAYQFPFSIAWLTPALPAGQKNIKIQCKRGGGNANPVQIFEVNAWVREVS